LLGNFALVEPHVLEKRCDTCYSSSIPEVPSTTEGAVVLPEKRCFGDACGSCFNGACGSCFNGACGSCFGDVCPPVETPPVETPPVSPPSFNTPFGATIEVNANNQLTIPLPVAEKPPPEFVTLPPKTLIETLVQYETVTTQVPTVAYVTATATETVQVAVTETVQVAVTETVPVAVTETVPVTVTEVQYATLTTTTTEVVPQIETVYATTTVKPEVSTLCLTVVANDP